MSSSAGNSPSMFCRSPNSDSSNSNFMESSLRNVPDYPEMTELPYLEILEQPVEKFRFRYKSELTGTHGSINGENSDRTRKITYPTVRLRNFLGDAVIRCSIYQHDYTDRDMKPHAHRLVWNRRSNREELDDPHDIYVDNKSYTAVYHNMGIIHTARKHLIAELVKKKRKLKKELISRYGNRELTTKEETEIIQEAESESKTINLNVVCLRFDAFTVQDDVKYPVCDPVFSRPINNLKSALTGDLRINRMDHCSSPVKGNREIFLFVERVAKKNIKIRFYEIDDSGNTVWESYGKFSDIDVHHQYAIAFKTPPYWNQDVTSKVKVYMELVRPSDNSRSDSREFFYIPNDVMYRPGAKRRLIDYDTSMSDEFLPTTINSKLESDELQILSKGIDSDEFNKVFRQFQPEFDTEIPRILFSNEFDFPVTQIESDFQMNGTEYHSKVVRVYEELSSFFKTKPSKYKAKQMIEYYLRKDDMNAFHLAVLKGDVKVIKFFLNVTLELDLDFVNIKSSLGTLLHLCILTKNLPLLKLLIGRFKADISLTDQYLNTPLHLATGEFMSVLLLSDRKKLTIDTENSKGDTPLQTAVLNENLESVQILCANGADPNVRHKCNGYTALRMAIDRNFASIIRYFLGLEVDHVIADFEGRSPFDVAILSEDLTGDLKKEIERYVKEKRIALNLDEVKVEIKSEVDSDEEFTIVSGSNHGEFTEECLDAVAEELDKGKNWRNLCELLELDHLIRFNMLDCSKSATRQVLTAAVKNGETVEKIRDCLDRLNESEAVRLIDQMIQK